MQVIRLSALSDNYIFLLHEPKQNIAAVVDPAVSQCYKNFKNWEQVGGDL